LGKNPKKSLGYNTWVFLIFNFGYQEVQKSSGNDTVGFLIDGYHYLEFTLTKHNIF